MSTFLLPPLMMTLEEKINRLSIDGLYRLLKRYYRAESMRLHQEGLGDSIEMRRLNEWFDGIEAKYNQHKRRQDEENWGEQ